MSRANHLGRETEEAGDIAAEYSTLSQYAVRMATEAEERDQDRISVPLGELVTGKLATTEAEGDLTQMGGGISGGDGPQVAWSDGFTQAKRRRGFNSDHESTGSLTGSLVDVNSPTIQNLMALLPYKLVTALVRGGYTSMEQIARTPDEELRVCRRIGTESMEIIRSAIPYDGPPTMRQLAQQGIEARMQRLEAQLVQLTEMVQTLTGLLTSLQPSSAEGEHRTSD